MSREWPTEREKEEYLDHIKGMSNEALLSEVWMIGEPHEEGGIITAMRYFEQQTSFQELKKRLKAIEFLK